jgi:hypothetical protein
MLGKVQRRHPYNLGKHSNSNKNFEIHILQTLTFRRKFQDVTWGVYDGSKIVWETMNQIKKISWSPRKGIESLIINRFSSREKRINSRKCWKILGRIW